MIGLSTTSVITGPSPKVESDWPASAEACLLRKECRSCHEYLVRACDAHGNNIGQTPANRIVPLVAQLQGMLFESGEYSNVALWICPDQKSLIRKLMKQAGDKRAMARCLLSVLLEGVTLFPESPAPEITRLKLDYLAEAYSIAKTCDQESEVSRLLAALVDTYFSYADQLPTSECFDKAFRLACFAANLLPPTQLSGDRQLDAEKAYLKRLGIGFTHLEKWAEYHIWEDRSPQAALAVVRVAERLIDYGELELARTLYGQAVEYGTKHPFSGADSIKQRYASLAQSGKIYGREPQWQQNRRMLQAIRELIGALFAGKRPNPEFPQFYTPLVLKCLGASTSDLSRWLTDLAGERHPIQQIQQMTTALFRAFAADLYMQAVWLSGPQPCRFTLMGFGSLARGDFAPYSDLDAVVLVERADKEVLEYFDKAACFFELLMLNLGETSFKEFLGSPAGRDGFRLDPAGLNPRRIICTSQQLLEQQQHWIEHLEGDIDPVCNALRQPSFICGSQPLFDQHRDSLKRESATPQFRGKLGKFLLSKWSAPAPRGDSFDAKRDLYRPVALLIDGLCVANGVNELTTADQLSKLRAIMPMEMGLYCERALELAAELRFQSQLHHRQEESVVCLEPKLGVIPPLLISSAQRDRLAQLDTKFFPKLAQLDLANPRALEDWNKVDSPTAVDVARPIQNDVQALAARSSLANGRVFSYMRWKYKDWMRLEGETPLTIIGYGLDCWSANAYRAPCEMIGILGRQGWLQARLKTEQYSKDKKEAVFASELVQWVRSGIGDPLVLLFANGHIQTQALSTYGSPPYDPVLEELSDFPAPSTSFQVHRAADRYHLLVGLKNGSVFHYSVAAGEFHKRATWEHRQTFSLGKGSVSGFAFAEKRDPPVAVASVEDERGACSLIKVQPSEVDSVPTRFHTTEDRVEQLLWRGNYLAVAMQTKVTLWNMERTPFLAGEWQLRGAFRAMALSSTNRVPVLIVSQAAKTSIGFYTMGQNGVYLDELEMMPEEPPCNLWLTPHSCLLAFTQYSCSRYWFEEEYSPNPAVGANLAKARPAVFEKKTSFPERSLFEGIGFLGGYILEPGQTYGYKPDYMLLYKKCLQYIDGSSDKKVATEMFAAKAICATQYDNRTGVLVAFADRWISCYYSRSEWCGDQYPSYNVTLKLDDSTGTPTTIRTTLIEKHFHLLVGTTANDVLEFSLPKAFSKDRRWTAVRRFYLSAPASALSANLPFSCSWIALGTKPITLVDLTAPKQQVIPLPVACEGIKALCWRREYVAGATSRAVFLWRIESGHAELVYKWKLLGKFRCMTLAHVHEQPVVIVGQDGSWPNSLAFCAPRQEPRYLYIVGNSIPEIPGVVGNLYLDRKEQILTCLTTAGHYTLEFKETHQSIQNPSSTNSSNNCVLC